MKKILIAGVMPADPTLWSSQSQRSVRAGWIREYKDDQYTCQSCGKAAVFTAADQKYTYEVKKAQIDQRRILCNSCWRVSLIISDELKKCEKEWVASRNSLCADRAFLTRWLSWFDAQAFYVRYGRDIARENMLRKLLAALCEGLPL